MFLVYLHAALISWYSKKQTAIETCTFGAEFVAMKTGIDTLQGIWYRLFEIVFSYCVMHIYGNIIHNIYKPGFVLKKYYVRGC